jgi:hypothetical protein
MDLKSALKGLASSPDKTAAKGKKVVPMPKKAAKLALKAGKK